MNHFALITGASQGIGKYMALELAKKGVSLVLVALPTTVLEETAQAIQIQYPAIEVHTIGVDLTEDNTAQKIYDLCQEKKITIQYLINNAGMGYTGAFDSFPIDFLDNLMKLNMLATTRLIRLFIDDLKQQPKAYILNVASIAGLY
ncbi:MAG: SDR family NAD(P)-dependent oxidoreductase, partial [Bacteroidota bacterium]